MSGICIISRDRLFSRMLELELSGNGVEVRTVTDKLNPAALALAADGFSVVVFDADYYGGDLSFINKRDIPVVVFGREENVVMPDNSALYYSRPFSVSEFKKKVLGLHSAPIGEDSGNDFSDLVAEMELDAYSKRVFLKGKTIKFSPKEFLLLSLLYRNRGKAVSRQEVLEAVWGDYDPKNNVDNVYINYLRNKLDAEFGVKMIYTVRGKGYMLK